jgi:steroid delta-isomerase-like uncharacterized protein
MSLKENKALIHCLIEVLNRQDLASLDELIAPDYVEHHRDHDTIGLDRFKQFVTMLHTSFPDFHRTLEDIIAEGDRVWIRLKYTGTHLGEFRGLAPTGKKFTATGVHIWRVVEGKVVETESVHDFLDFYKQLGVIEYTEKGKKLFPEDTK